MNAAEAGQLLAILSAADRREIDATTAQSWAWLLHDVPLDRALQAARRAYGTGRYVDVNAILTELRAMQPRLEADVRSAKLRGLIPSDWPPKQPLSLAMETQLRSAQAVAWRETNDLTDELTTNRHLEPQLGLQLRTTD